MEVKKDKLRREILVGEMVCYASSGNYPTPFIGKVVGFTLKKVKVVELYPWNDDDGPALRIFSQRPILKEDSNLIQIPIIQVPIKNSKDEVIKWEDITEDTIKNL